MNRKLGRLPGRDPVRAAKGRSSGPEAGAAGVAALGGGRTGDGAHGTAADQAAEEAAGYLGHA
ncbi:hypothetical protein RKD37_003218 [Streptomyces ambofaciens]